MIKSFKEFISEAKTTKKVFISHLDKMPPLEFLALISELDQKYKGILSRDKISITEKIDGMVLRIGQDREGRSFIESSAQGSMYNVGDFTAKDKARGGDGSMGKKFDFLLKKFKADKKVQKFLAKYNNGNGIKIIGEILHTPMGIADFDTIKFVRIAYERAKLGTEWTFVPFKVIDDDGIPYVNSDEVKRGLYAISDSDRKYVPPTLNISRDIDISTEISKFKDDILTKYKTLDVLLTSRKHADRELKAAVTAQIAEYQKVIAKKVISYVKGGLFGKEYEGVVVELPNGTIVKVVSDLFKTAPKPEWTPPKPSIKEEIVSESKLTKYSVGKLKPGMRIQVGKRTGTVVNVDEPSWVEHGTRTQKRELQGADVKFDDEKSYHPGGRTPTSYAEVSQIEILSK